LVQAASTSYFYATETELAAEISLELLEFEDASFTARLGKLRELEKLEDNWDSYGGRAPSPKAVAIGEALVRDVYQRTGVVAYNVAPLADGGVQIEWRKQARAIEVEIGPEGDLSYLDTGGDEEENLAYAQVLELASSVVC
jgi:hypothetical protein